MRKSLFNSVRQWQGPTTMGETTFEFLQRGGRTDAIEIRRWMEKWFRKFPEEHKEELRKRLQSRNFDQFMGAYFELQVYSVLRLLGCDVKVHPDFAGTDGVVDFGVTHMKDRFYVEATVCGIDQGVLSSNANEEDAVRKVREEIRHPHSDVWLEAEGELLQTLGRKRIVNPIKELLDSCSADAVYGLGEVYAWLRPRTSIQEGKWRLDVFLARPIASDGKGRVQGPGRGGSADGSLPIARALRKKVEDWAGKKYDEATFVIALNVCHSEYCLGDELKAIYGKPDPDAGQDSFSRHLSRVAGVVVFGNATLGHERGASVQMYVNPDRGAPECLRFLQQKKSLGGLIGLA